MGWPESHQVIFLGIAFILPVNEHDSLASCTVTYFASFTLYSFTFNLDIFQPLFSGA